MRTLLFPRFPLAAHHFACIGAKPPSSVLEDPLAKNNESMGRAPAANRTEQVQLALFRCFRKK
jgi:hypothetical protein